MAAPGVTLRPLSRTVLTASPALSTTTLRIVPRRFPQSLLNRQSPSLHSASRSPLVPHTQIRHSSYHSPEPSPNTPNARKKVTMTTLRNLYKKGEPIAMITAHDFPSARAADESGMDMVLVGDSLGMVAMGLENTTEIVMEEMLLHCRSVARGAKHAFLVGDLPMGSYEISPEQAVGSALRFIKEGRVHGVKIEGGEELAPTIKRITQAGIPVVGHIGLTPQRQNALGGFRVQGKTCVGAMKILQDALALQEAGVFMFVFEAMPPEVAALITSKLKVPTIGIGAGNGCSGQVLVQVDMTGNFQPGRFIPKFVKKYADVWGEATRGMIQYREEVKSREFPSPEYTYPISKEELAKFEKTVDEMIQK
ncbi:3-methyl-2-oxobutanoate hydroxymethyltransferase [Penicillium subrubescens]|uniref:3-methyl-2-oxobutanoate hydroxymethyltransferase n=1 Tax=Penicillium subrubescens TaxID=1316194 RepID=A0A1Q5UL20_9EURO|nr:3-methyl-2-oxobutanoate hydroxymethyltransferase [Penicillium subrubescens]KAJ5905832.1 3-methyl-2-oxobutanoate hydroxymethyltransferase [Penicillium subrubescens]OKP13153.1 3-methyl-2-oxobutanoate hydroxymethyltransferase [Penicillium subrubescens]